MKIQHQNDTEILLTDSGRGAVALGVILILVGAGVVTGLIVAGSIDAVALIIPALFILIIAVLFIVTAKNRRLTLRKNASSEVIETSVITKKSVRQEFETSSITSVNLEVHTEYDYDSDSKGGRSSSSRKSALFLTLADASEVLLGRASKSGGLSIQGVSLSSFGKPALSKEAEAISSFLGVPLLSGAHGIIPKPGTPNTTTGQPMATQPPTEPFGSSQSLPQPSAPPSQPIATAPAPADPFASTPPQPTPPTQNANATPPYQEMR